jgi:Fibrobacter succinogenes major domain (Fib_succ_major).
MNKFSILFCIFIFALPERSAGIYSDFPLIEEAEEIDLFKEIILVDTPILMKSHPFFLEGIVLQAPSPGDGSSGGSDSGSGGYVDSREAASNDAFVFLIFLTIIYVIYLNKFSHMKSKHLIILLFTISYPSVMTAQVRIGGSSSVTKGAILDLKSSSSEREFIGGLLLPNVYIKDKKYLPGGTGYFSDFPENDVDTDLTLEGLIVYNTNAEIGKGIYYWDGNDWQSMNTPGNTGDNDGGDDEEDPGEEECEECTSVIFNGITYRTKFYGDQCWMIENIRTQIARDSTQLSQTNSVGTGSGNSDGYKFAYPNKNSSNVSKMGLLYDWKSANNVCPPGWHLPSESEWAEGLENGISSDPSNWNNQGYPGRIYDGTVSNFGAGIYWWASTILTDDAKIVSLSNGTSNTFSKETRVRSNFICVRCIRD